jgi:hypothetical protein
MTEIKVCKTHEVVGHIHFLGQHPILNLSGVATSLILTDSSPSVSTALDKFAASRHKNLKCAFTWTIHKPDIGSAIGVDDY